jgi:4-hydroxybutyryl-CoA dehydratase / vinylacetyl-CoA-Delta-isomerase
MTVRTAINYIESLRDGRLIYADGVEIRDIVKNEHAALKSGLRLASFEYVIAAHPKYRSLLVEESGGKGPYHFAFKPPRSSDDLLRRRSIIQKLARMCYGMPGAAHFTGIDALHALGIVTRRMDAEANTCYSPLLEAFREQCKKEDLGLALGMVGPPGQKAETPEKSGQHRDFSLNIVGESRQGITVSGVMAHMTFAPYVHEIVILPAHGMREEERGHAIAFAVPVNSKGIKLILPRPEQVGEGNYFDHPLLAHAYAADSMVVFDNVFVPRERIFMKGEYQYAGATARMFSNFHRLSGDSRKVADLESLVGAAFLIAGYNGLERYSHIQDKLAQLVYYAETTEALGRAAALDCITDPASGFVFPGPMLANLAKYTYAEFWHRAVKMLQDIAGGLVATMPSGKDFYNPALRSTIEPYLSGREGAAAEDRIRAVNLVRDLSAPSLAAAAIHGEGSLIMQKMAFLKEADRFRYLSAAKHAAGIRDDNPHSDYSDMPDFSGIDRLLANL